MKKLFKQTWWPDVKDDPAYAVKQSYNGTFTVRFYNKGVEERAFISGVEDEEDAVALANFVIDRCWTMFGMSFELFFETLDLLDSGDEKTLEAYEALKRAIAHED